jgi:hypothetical protein
MYGITNFKFSRIMLSGMGGDLNYIDLAQDKHKLRAALNKVISFRVPKSAGNFLTGRLLASHALLCMELIVVQRRPARHSWRLAALLLTSAVSDIICLSHACVFVGLRHNVRVLNTSVSNLTHFVHAQRWRQLVSPKRRYNPSTQHGVGGTDMLSRNVCKGKGRFSGFIRHWGFCASLFVPLPWELPSFTTSERRN